MGYKLTKAGYICVTVFEAGLVAVQVYYFKWRRVLSKASMTVSTLTHSPVVDEGNNEEEDEYGC
jgi:hypothetical protein